MDFCEYSQEINIAIILSNYIFNRIYVFIVQNYKYIQAFYKDWNNTNKFSISVLYLYLNKNIIN